MKILRLFVAVNFNEKIKKSLAICVQRLQKYAACGNFTRAENLHLTLAFIGETSRPDTVKQAMDSVISAPFSFIIEDTGRFKRPGGDIFWAGIRENHMLGYVQKLLCSSLRSNGFALDNRVFSPHLTLARKILLPGNFDNRLITEKILPMQVNVEKISLMKSERINGVLKYTEIYAKALSQKNQHLTNLR